MAWMETDFSKHMYLRWKIKWRLKYLEVEKTLGMNLRVRIRITSSYLPQTILSLRERCIVVK